MSHLKAEERREAERLAAANGFRLRQPRSDHFILECEAGFLINLYPTKWRIYWDRNRPKPPYIKPERTGDSWVLSCVRALVAALGGDPGEPKQAEPERTFILYDARACAGMGADDAAVFEVCTCDGEARSAAGEYGSMACYSYREEGRNLKDARWEWDWHPEGGFTDA